MRLLFDIYQWVFWNVFTRPFFVGLFLYRTYRFARTSASRPFPPPPFLVVSNHGTFFDPWIVGGYSRYPFGIMTNDDGFHGSRVSRWYLRTIGAFPKKKGTNDYRAMKTTLTLLRRGKPVLIFPEGQTTWDGETQPLYPGIEKLVRRAGCPLVSVRLQGNFLTKPWWAKTVRKGKIRVTFTVHPEETLRRLSDDELFDLIRRSIYQNDIKDPENRAIPFTGKNLAEGLERFVWICLGCGAEDSLVTSGDTVSCRLCGGSWRMDPYCRLEPVTAGCRDLKDWAELHKDRVKRTIGTRPETLTRSEGIVLQLEKSEHIFEEAGEGSATLLRDEIRFTGPGFRMSWPVAEIGDCVIQKKDIFEFRHGAFRARFLFSGKSPMKWIHYLRYIKGYEHCERQGHL